MNPIKSKHEAFTLVELLVVIAIIALLMAVLLPALNGARYRTRLTVCSSNQRMVAVAATTRAADHNGMWPTRAMPFIERGWSAPNILKYTDPSEPAYSFDDRPNLTPYIPINEVVQCPFNQNFDFKNADSVQIHTSTAFFFGYQFSKGEQKLERLSDRMTFQGDEFDILVTDHFQRRDPYTDMAHPDHSGAPMTVILTDDATWIRNWYRLPGSLPGDGSVDLNYTRTDGSGFRVYGVNPNDPRLKKVPGRNKPASYILSSGEWRVLPDVRY
ncbi:MAG: prepilin-type N-terminal cleavage/methylation domain-containing protein [Phycisphaera sp.]|nr:prepilin-type N-terminal cleavage/methylation domain-containing protein [Phycisphaera sp.]